MTDQHSQPTSRSRSIPVSPHPDVGILSEWTPRRSWLLLKQVTQSFDDRRGSQLDAKLLAHAPIHAALVEPSPFGGIRSKLLKPRGHQAELRRQRRVILTPTNGPIVTDQIGCPGLAAIFRGQHRLNGILHMNEVQPGVGIAREQSAASKLLLASQQPPWTIQPRQPQYDGFVRAGNLIRLSKMLPHDSLRITANTPIFFAGRDCRKFIHKLPVVLSVNAGAGDIHEPLTLASNFLQHVSQTFDVDRPLGRLTCPVKTDGIEDRLHLRKFLE